MRFQSHVDLPRPTREELIALLNIHLADALELHAQVKQAHWNVRGHHFQSLHQLFDEVAHHVLEQTDRLAERVGALGGYAQGTLRLAVRHSELDEYDTSAVSGEEHLRVLVDRFTTYAASLRRGIHRCGELDERVTEDLYTELLGQVEQDLWLLDSHLYGSSTLAREEAAPHEILEQLMPSPES